MQFLSKFFLLSIAAVLYGGSDGIDCSKEAAQINYYSKRFAANFFYPQSDRKYRIAVLPHHSITAASLDAAYSYLSRTNSEISKFILISPDHFSAIKGKASVCQLPFISGQSILNPDYKLSQNICLAGADPESIPFEREHGIKTHIPLIAKYFPKSSVTALILNDKTRDISLCRTIGAAAGDLMTCDSSIFLIVSSDFSHKSNDEQTRKRDGLTMKYLTNWSSANPNSIDCDCRSGMILLSSVMKKIKTSKFSVISNFSSSDLNCGKNNVTSYFFLFAE